MLEAMLHEFTTEAAVTRNVLSRVPSEKLDWQPHPRSMTLGQLAMHIATVPVGILRITETDTFDVTTNTFRPPAPSSSDEINAAFEKTVNDVTEKLTTAPDTVANGPWHLMKGATELVCMPRVSAWRSLMLNHWYHHRGQLAVYLRMLDIPVPSIYGPSADESPFA
jgi:uncharacterized damage-inducible protein DinB